MSENSAGERSEAATPKREKESREKGQVTRSKELTTAMLLMTASLSLYSFSNSMGEGFAKMAKKSFALDRNFLFDDRYMLFSVGSLLGDIASAVTPFFLLLYAIGLFSPMLIGGMSFSSKALAPQASRMSLGKGFKRMFGLHALVELIKALAKVSVVFIVGYFVLLNVFPSLIELGNGPVNVGIAQAMDTVSYSFFLISLSLLLIALIDVPYQIWNHSKQLKMTKQEVKDEYKETEGKPEVKGKIRQAQRELAQRRMMDSIPDADVVVTNPEHYSVAIKYDAMHSSAPIVVAKGADIIAMQIRKVAIANDVMILPAPPLARAIYHTTEIGQEIPSGLYLAVAQVLAYIFQMKSFMQGKHPRPEKLKDLPIPDEFKY